MNFSSTNNSITSIRLHDYLKKSWFKPGSVWPGLLLATFIALVAWRLGAWLPAVGSPIFAIVLGVAVRNSIGLAAGFKPGVIFASKRILQWSIILLGFGLSFNQVVQTGLSSIWVTLITIGVAFVVAALVGRWLGVADKLRTLIGAGTAICGGSAIAAIAPIIEPEEQQTAMAISTIFLFNVAAVIIFPFFGHLLNMSDAGFGLWAGTAINDTSSVVAAAYSFSSEAGDYATIVKLTRATFIIPLCVFYVMLVLWQQKQHGVAFSLNRLIPWFIVWFVMASLMRSTGWLPDQVLMFLEQGAKFFMVLALAAIGLSSQLRLMANNGWQPIVLGLVTWVAVALSSLLVQVYSGAW